MSFYIIQNDIVCGMYESVPRNHIGELLESDENYDLGGTLKKINGKWVYSEPSLTISEIDAQLSAIDSKKVRPMSAILAAGEGDDTSEDMAYLSELEAQAVAFRAQRAELVGE